MARARQPVYNAPNMNEMSSPPSNESVEPDNDTRLSENRAESARRGWARDVYWEDELMQFATAGSDEQSPAEIGPGADQPLAISDF